MIDKLKEALSYISDRHVAEAANAKKHRKPYFLGAVAAVLVLVLLFHLPSIPMAIRAKAVSVAEYPDYEWEYRQNAEQTQIQLLDFFSSSIRTTLSGASGANQAYSPINLYMALAVTAELTGSNTRTQILDQLNIDSIDTLRAQANELWNACYRDGNNHTLLANSLWLDNGLDYNQDTMDALAEIYYTSVYQGDLGSSKTNKAIRAWLNNQTNGLLKQEIQNAGIQPDPNTIPVLALYSTVYFQAKWSDTVQFSAANNTADTFHAPSGKVACTFMNKKELESNYYWGKDFGAIYLNMKGDNQMWLILPDEDKTVDDVLTSGEYLQAILSPESYYSEEENTNRKYMKINLSLPKFDIRANGDLKEDLQAMGITDIFDSRADFTASVESSIPVWITNVNQATRVAIDEEGVTAASYIEFPAAGAAPPPEEIIDFILDRPFIFVITNTYNLPLFAGVVNEP